MTRNLKTLGLFLAAIFALSAMGATAASAVEFHSASEHTTVTGSQEGTDEFTVTAGTSKCNEANYTATQEASTVGEIEITPTYSECTFGFPAQITMAECKYRFHGLTATPHEAEATDYHGLVDIVCPAGQDIVIHAKAFGVNKCTVTVKPQTNIPGTVTTTNFDTGGGKKHVRVHVELTGIKYTQIAGSGFGACANSDHTETGEPGSNPGNGTYKGTATITGKNKEGAETNVWIE